MKRIILFASTLALALLGCAFLQTTPETAPAAATPDLPRRHTPTPSSLIGQGTPAPTLLLTAPFAFPTHAPQSSPTPTPDCTAVFPIETVEAIEFGSTTIPQLEAAFGRAVARGGRPTRLRFEFEGCILLVTVSLDTADEAELVDYGTLGLLLDRYGPPATAAVSEGNLVLPPVGSTVLLYPDRGIITVFDAAPDELTRAALPSSLIFRPPYESAKQVKRLKLALVKWQPPLR